MEKSRELVILLHGIGQSRMRMAFVNYRLKRAGYKTLNLSYPSLRRDITSCADFVLERILQRMPPEIDKIHFMAHSMGCLVTLHILATGTLEKAARAVFIAPPYRGSEVADFLQNVKFYKFMFGPAGAQLTTQYRSNITYALPASIEIGVIAGSRAYEHPFFLKVMKKTGVHDGLVSLESTRIPEIKDHITLRLSHSFLLEKSAAQTVHFLEHGRFISEKE